MHGRRGIYVFILHTGIQLAFVLDSRNHTYWNKQVRDPSLVLLPRLAISRSTLLDIAPCSVSNHTCKENGIKPRERAIESRDEAPGHGKEEVRGVMNFPSMCDYHR